MHTYLNQKIKFSLALVALNLLAAGAFASSHQDAPLIIMDPAANTTDVYAFVTQSPITNFVATNIFVTNTVGTNLVTNTVATNFATTSLQQYLTVALSVYPFEEPGSGPNPYRFDDNVVYVIYVMNRKGDLASGRADFGYQFRFQTTYQNNQTILQAFTGVVTNVGDASQNLVQTYSVTKVDFRNSKNNTFLGTGIVPPNNQGNATPFYNQGGNGENPVFSGAVTPSQLDTYTAEGIATNLSNGYLAFAGQRDDAFFGDIQAVFDLLKFRNPGVDAQGGFNVHTIVLNIPVEELGGTQQVAGVYAATYRQQFPILRDGVAGPSMRQSGAHVQVARQGNPLFNELFVPIAAKDLYSRTSPTSDKNLFAQYALNPEPAALANALLFANSPLPDIESDRTDLAGIFIPDVLKVDLSTGPVRLAGGGGVPDDAGFSRLGLFGGDTLTGTVTTNVNNGVVSGGWPNGRRFGDDVVDIALTALVSNLRVSPPIIRFASDNVPANDIPFNKVFPYAPTPQNGRDHFHHQ